MVDVALIEEILREQDNPGASTTRQIRDLYNSRSNGNPIVQHSDDDKEFQRQLLKALEAFPLPDEDDDEDDRPISYTVKLKDSDDSCTPTAKRRSIIKLPKEKGEYSESEESSSDSEKPRNASSLTTSKPFSPLFLNNMKKFGVSSDWLAKRSNSLRQSAYSRSSVTSNTSKLDAMIKSASAKPIRSNRKLSFVETTAAPAKVETDKENSDPSVEIDEKKDGEDEPKDAALEPAATASYDLSSEVEEDKDNDNENELSPSSKDFALRIPRVDVSHDKSKPASKRSSSMVSSSSDNDEPPQPEKQKRKPKTETPVTKKATTKRASKKKKSKDEQAAKALPQPSPEQSEDEKKASDANTPVKAKKTKRKKASAETQSDKMKKTKQQPKASDEEESDKDDEINKIKRKKASDENPPVKTKNAKQKKVSDDDEESKQQPEASDEEESEKAAETKKTQRKKASGESQSVKTKKPKQTKASDDDEPDKTEETKQPEASDEAESEKTDETKKTKQKKDKSDQEQSRIEHLKKLLRISGIRQVMKRAELDELPSFKAKINYLKSQFDKAGYTGSLTIKDCQKFREKRDTEKELFEIQQSAVDVQGIVKGGRTLRGQAQANVEPSAVSKRKREPSNEVDGKIYGGSSDDEKPTMKRRRVLQMEASPEVTDNE